MSDASDLAVVSRGNGRFDVVAGTKRHTAYALHTGSESWVFFAGRIHVVKSTGGTRPQHKSGHHIDDDAALAAPMPATVVSVNVDPGQQVKRGDVLITLEAMKMELAIRAPRDGTVRRVACQRGELVQPGVQLLELE